MLSVAQQAAFREAGKRYAVFFRLAAVEPIRLWSGVGDFELPADGIETTEGARYDGIQLMGLPSLSALINGKASRIEFSLSGAAVDEEVAALATRDAHLVQGKSVRLGILPLDKDWQPVWPVRWLFRGEADVVRVTQQPGEEGGVERRVTLSAGTRFSGRRQPRDSFYTPQDQAGIDPADKAFDNVALMNEGSEKTWPRG